MTCWRRCAPATPTRTSIPPRIREARSAGRSPPSRVAALDRALMKVLQPILEPGDQRGRLGRARGQPGRELGRDPRVGRNLGKRDAEPLELEELGARMIRREPGRDPLELLE